MSEETNVNGLSHVTHVYYEIAGELLSKPNALAQIIEGQAIPACLVFCNTPSDTDLVEVLLKKRGVPARKLIGNVPTPKLEKTMSQLRSGEISTVVVTDIAARGIDIDDFDAIINYTAPSDGDTYAHRISKSGPFNRLKKVMTLVGPLDITNFHYVQKTVEKEFISAQLPTPEDIQAAKIERLSLQATQKAIGEDEKYKVLAATVAGHKNCNSIIALLLQNTFETIPTLQLAAEREEEPMDDDDDMDNRGNGRFNNRQDGGRGRGRDDRGGDRNQGGHDRGARGGDDRRGARRPYADLDEGYEDNNNNDRDRERPRREQRPMLPPLREARIYVGEGSSAGMSAESLKGLVEKQTGLVGDDIRRIVLRKNYSFFDVLDEKSEDAISKLQDIKGSDGDMIIVKKATTISSQRHGAPVETDENTVGSEQPSLNEETAQDVA